jgi:hypothetical protein
VDFKLAGTTGGRARREVEPERQPQRQPQRHEQKPRSAQEARRGAPSFGVAPQAPGQPWHAPQRGGERRPQRGSGRSQSRRRR